MPGHLIQRGKVWYLRYTAVGGRRVMKRDGEGKSRKQGSGRFGAAPCGSKSGEGGIRTPETGFPV
jgi:hypothetical protein